MNFKKIAGFCFIVAFTMAMIIYTHSSIISYFLAKKIFLFSGIIAFFLNLISFKDEKNKPDFNFLFWVGTIFLYVGLFIKINSWPMSTIVIYLGLTVTGVSFFYNPKLNNSDKFDSNESDDIIDN